MMPTWLKYTVFVLVAVSWIPLAFIARARTATSEKPRIHIIPDMDAQPKWLAQSDNPLFADGRAMRPQVEGTVARGQLSEDDCLYRGRVGERWLAEFPLPVTSGLMQRGRERYEVFCAPCHGLSGKGDGLVARRADRLQEGTWVPPTSLHLETVRGREVGYLFNTITHGVRTMPAYGSQIPVKDRWAIVAYLRALQRSQSATMDDVPESERDAFLTR